MIILKANSELKKIFHKMINTMGENITWTDVFVINNNDIILAGENRSFLFNFDNRKAGSVLVELPVEMDKAVLILKNTLLEDTLNMILYAFGKWGQIKGLKVETDYARINELIRNILDEINIEAALTRDNFRFYQNGIQITYEEVIQMILDRVKPVSEEAAPEENEEMPNEYKIGLWHKMQWVSDSFSFIKAEFSEEDKAGSRLGHEFYMVKYQCPHCKDKLYMVVYPAGKEFRIETDIAPVYMARAYTCNSCNTFYTPKPHKLLIDGDIFWLNFEDDREAYEDYLELLGEEGRRTSNLNFNEYETLYNAKIDEAEGKLEEICNGMDEMSEREIDELKDKMDSAFYPEESVDKYYDVVSVKIKKRKHDDQADDKENIEEPEKIIKSEDVEPENLVESKESEEPKEPEEPERLEEPKNPIEIEKIIDFIMKDDNENFDTAVKKLPNRQRENLKEKIRSEKNLGESAKKDYIDKIEKIEKELYKKKEKELLEKASPEKFRNYQDILKCIEEIEKEVCPEIIKEPIIKSLMIPLEKRGNQELISIVSKIPENITRKQYEQFREKIDQYKRIDNQSQKIFLDEKRDEVEKQEIADFVKKANAKNRRALSDLYNKLKEQGFAERNTAPYLEKIRDKIYKADEKEIKKICPSPEQVTFDEGLKAYEEISEGIFLPELKGNILNRIDRRLMNMKMGECEKLVDKLSKDMDFIAQDNSRIHFYDVRKNEDSDKDMQIINNALNSYGYERGKYEYPILICDASHSENGGTGFILTPDHIFYSGLISMGKMNVMNIEGVYSETGLLNSGIYVTQKDGTKVKISNSLKLKKLPSFAKVLSEFIIYLKEKPESRNISYMMKEKHAVKCCYRCGYVYKSGDVCPKCGSKYNE